MSFQTYLYRHRAWLRENAQDPTTPSGQRSAWWYEFFYDHGAIRRFWSNTYEIAPGVFRANQPSNRRFNGLAARGIKTVINLRGASDLPQFLSEKATCARLGLTLVNVEGFSARVAPPRSVLQAALQALISAEKPVVFHCKSGADRTSLLAAIYLIVAQDTPVHVARKQLGLRYIHFKWTETGVLDHVLNAFETAQAETGIDFETWLDTVYDADEIQRSFETMRTR